MFDLPAAKKNMLRPRSNSSWQRQVEFVMQRFQRTFPEIVYDIAWKVDAPNGTAWKEISQRHVRLYGGLLRHKLINVEGVALLFAHETGHHYGGAPRDGTYTWMTCEAQADFWAARWGINAVWANDPKAARHQVLEGAKQLLKFETGMNEAGTEWPSGSRRPRGCLEHSSPRQRYRIFMSAINS